MRTTILAALLSAGLATAAHAQEAPELVARWHEAIGLDARGRVAQQLKAKGYCYGPPWAYGYQQKWEPCSPDYDHLWSLVLSAPEGFDSAINISTITKMSDDRQREWHVATLLSDDGLLIIRARVAVDCKGNYKVLSPVQMAEQPLNTAVMKEASFTICHADEMLKAFRASK